MPIDVREEAANLLSALASDAAAGDSPSAFTPPGEWSRAAREIAYVAHRVDPALTLTEQFAEAEARIRDGTLAHSRLPRH